MRQKDYENRVGNHEAIHKKLTGISNKIGCAKLFGILILGLTIYFLFARSFPISLIIVSSLLLMSLIILWIYHHKLHEKINYSSSIIVINRRHLDRISGKWTAFPDMGAEFISQEHPYSSDLDIVGQKSFFQFINTTHTWHGRQAFAKDLLHPHYGIDELKERQKAIKELSKDIDFSNHLEHSFSKIGLHSSVQKLTDGLKDRQLFIKSKLLKTLLMYVPMVTFVLVAATVLFRLEGLYIAATSIIAVQTVVWIAGIGRPHNYLNGISGLPYKLRAYGEVIEILLASKFNSKKLKQIQTVLSEPSAAEAIKDLHKIAAKVSIRHNVLIWVAANALLLWDYECAIKFEAWKQKYAHAAEGWFHALGEFESLLSFSHLPNMCNNTCLPSPTTEKAVEAQALGHPLIPNNARINNHVSCKDNIFIISGSNMSGKTTFMRTVGINLVLARAGSFVCAKEMSFYPLEIMTSMRIADDLNEGISTFYAELTRIKGIITLAEKNSNMIFLIDEIFRGTNSVDRLSGAMAVLKRLDSLNAIGMITTHDLELCEIANQFSRIKNYGFSEEYRDNQIHFDYILKSGKSITTNAKYLMEMVGI